MNVVGHIRPAAARRGHDMVMAPHLLCYYDYRQDLLDDPFQYIGGHILLEKAYSFDPCDGVASGSGNGRAAPAGLQSFRAGSKGCQIFRRCFLSAMATASERLAAPSF